MSTKKDLNRLKNVFSRSVEELALTGVPLLEALVQMKEEFGVEDEEIKACLTDHLKEKLAVEAGRLHLVKVPKNSISGYF